MKLVFFLGHLSCRALCCNQHDEKRIFTQLYFVDKLYYGLRDLMQVVVTKIVLFILYVTST
jgi:hypothetical protein